MNPSNIVTSLKCLVPQPRVVQNEHVYLFARAVEVFAANRQPEFRLRLIQLYKAIRRHFANEQALMLALNFPGYQAQVDLHFALVTRLDALSTCIGNDQWNVEDVQTFMRDWALSHTLLEDAKLARPVR